MKFLILAILAFLMMISCDNDSDHTAGRQLRGKWVETPYTFPLPGLTETVSFSIGNTWYTGLGRYDNKGHRQFFRFVPGRGWESVAEFPGRERLDACAFVLDGKAYVGLGRSLQQGAGEECYKDFWIYDPQQNVWDSLTLEFPGEGRIGAVAFTDHGCGYVGTGRNNYKDLGDFYEFSSLRGWERKEELTLNARSYATVFNADGGHFLCFGGEGTGYVRDVKKFSSSPLSWVAMRPFKKEDKPDMVRAHASAVVLNEGGQNKVYVMGGNSVIWCCCYDPQNDSWSVVENVEKFGTYFVVDNTLYSIDGITTYRFEKEN